MSERNPPSDTANPPSDEPGTKSIDQEASQFQTEELTDTDTDASAALSSRFNSLLTGFYVRFPRLARVLSSFRHDPLSGNTLRMLITGTDGITRDQKQVGSLRPATMWEPNAPIVISQYGNYSSSILPRYWNTTLPDIEERYGDNVRYEHHDVPVPDQSLEPYKLSTIGRAIQHNAGTQAFWSWFNAIMIDGVRSADEGWQLASQLGIDVKNQTLKDAIKHDIYSKVILNDIHSLFEKVDQKQADEFETQIDNGDPIFALFINGVQVEPSYDSIVGAIEQRQVMYDTR